VRTLATGYTGDLRTDDRVLDVPAATLSVSATWTGRRWLGAISATRATDWIDYDRLALARSYLKFDRRAVPLVGADLRGYWRTYDGSTHLRASLTRSFGRGLSLVVTGENLLGAQRGEPDNVTILPGRTVTTGLRATFF
jgi:iron complex outermembrane receptor protein